MLRGERSAVETYQEVIEKYGDNPAMDELRGIWRDHQQSVSELDAHIRSLGGEPDTDSGAWGFVTGMIQKTANLFGEESAVESLEKGEKKGLEDYKDALEGDCITAECRTMYQTKLIPRIESHLKILDEIEDAVD